MADTILQKTNVTLKMLIDRKILAPGQNLICDNLNVHAVLNEDGSIKVFFNGEEKIFPFLSGAARTIEGKSLNGWVYWQIMTNDGKVSLSAVRDTYVDYPCE